MNLYETDGMGDIFEFRDEPFGVMIFVDDIPVLRVSRVDGFSVEKFPENLSKLSGHADYYNILETIDSVYTRLSSRFKIKNDVNETMSKHTLVVDDGMKEASARVFELFRILNNKMRPQQDRRNAIFELNGWLDWLSIFPDLHSFTSLYKYSSPNIPLLKYNAFDVSMFVNVFHEYCESTESP